MQMGLIYPRECKTGGEIQGLTKNLSDVGSIIPCVDWILILCGMSFYSYSLALGYRFGRRWSA